MTAFTAFKKTAFTIIVKKSYQLEDVMDRSNHFRPITHEQQ